MSVNPAFLGVIATCIIQLGVIIYSYGKLTQKVDNLVRKIDNGWGSLCERVAKLEEGKVSK